MDADRLIADLTGAVSDRGEISAVVRPPVAGERQPGSLLPLPATDHTGHTVFLWSSLVIDWREHRVIVPEVWEPSWLALDLARALQDLRAGSPLSLGYLDGSDGGEGLPVSLLSGRWNVAEWHPEVSPPDLFDVVLIRDGTGLESISSELPLILDEFAERGGGVLVAPSAGSAAPTAAGSWAAQRSLEQPGDIGSNRVIYSDSEELFRPESYRDLDTALLLAAGRDDLLLMMASDIGIARNRGRGKTGTRLLRTASNHLQKKNTVPENAKEIAFSSQGIRAFILEKSGGSWFLVSGEWRLSARSDRVESFLSRLRKGSPEAWPATDNAALVNHDLIPGSTVEIIGEKGKVLTLDFAGERRSGGGVWYRTDSGTGLWPLLNGAETSGDPRYWMERRLYPLTEMPIRVELSTDSTLYWRLHTEDGVHFYTRRDGSRNVMDSDSASDFLGRLLRAEALTIAPSENRIESPLELILEDRGGRRISYRMGDLPDGRVAGESPDGILYVLDESLVEFILTGPEDRHSVPKSRQ